MKNHVPLDKMWLVSRMPIFIVNQSETGKFLFIVKVCTMNYRMLAVI